MSLTPRIECAHCKSTGTCSNGPDLMSCTVCMGRYAKGGTSTKGLVCSVCEGRGSVESFTVKLQNRFLPFFAMGFVALLIIFIALAYFFGNKGFDKIIGFAGTLIGSITGYYFGGRQVDASGPPTKPKPMTSSLTNERTT